MVQTVLNVAEKPSVAKEISKILSSGNPRRKNGFSQYNPVYEFNYSISNEPCNMIVTSVAGHLMETDFTETHRSWRSCNPLELFQAPIIKSVKNDPTIKNIVKTIKAEARRSQMLVLWLDCDREGENIAFEVKKCCEESNRRLRVMRAKFSALIPHDIHYAMRNLVSPDQRLADAVDARSEIDLRIGAAFTRFQTMRIQSKFAGLSESVISYGPCQFPTLGFVVDRYLRIEAFVREQFWYIFVSAKQEESSAPSGFIEVEFTWSRNRLFDRIVCLSIFELCIENPLARVVNMTSEDTTKKRPFPLSTVELQKRASRWLRIPSEQTMKIAEDLYNRGLISYPRTETDKFKDGTDLTSLLQGHNQHPTWGQYVSKLLSEGKFQWPRNGSNDDQAHPPIHPTKSVPLDTLNADEKKIYDLVCRHFFACCSEDAKGHQTKVDIQIFNENFNASGLMIIAKNYLEIYTFEKWNAKTIPVFTVGDEFIPENIQLKEGHTNPPPLLSESDLISEMDKNGIGTDATIAEHIKTILKRNYAIKVNNNSQFKPTDLGLALVKGYNQMGLQLSKPYLRAAMERDCKDIALGIKSFRDVTSNCLQQMNSIFRQVCQSAEMLDDALAVAFQPGHVAANFRTIVESFSKCGQCENTMTLRCREGTRNLILLQCTQCNSSLTLPSKGVHSAHNQTCILCNYQVVQINSGNGYDGNGYTVCPQCYNNPPTTGDMNFACFKCSESNCSLSGGTSRNPIMKCKGCLINECFLKKTRSGRYVITCSGYPNTCSNSSIWLPNGLTSCNILQDNCERCSRGESIPVKKLSFQFASGSVPLDVPLQLIDCILCSTILRDISPPGASTISLPSTNSSIPNRDPEMIQNSFQTLNQNINTNNRTSYSNSSINTGNHNAGGLSDLRNQPYRENYYPPDEMIPNRGNQPSHGASNLEVLTCLGHGLPCVLRVTRKAGENQGREFYSCSLPREESCDFFQWRDQISSNEISRPNTNNHPQHLDIRTSSQSVVCDCQLPCTKRTSGTSKNLGRVFYKCGDNDKCKYFKWEDEIHNTSSSSTFNQSNSNYIDLIAKENDNGNRLNVIKKCHCGVECVNRVAGTAHNKGRRFLTCGSDGRCDFFEWEDDDSSTSHSSMSNNNTSNNPKCEHALPCVLRVTKKTGPNQGRGFFTCSLPQDQKCNFFEWKNPDNH